MNHRAMPALLGDDIAFPPAELALADPEGLLAIGGDLSPPRLLEAYRHGIFPWYSAGQPILWWSPDPRMVFRSDGVHLSSRFRRGLRAPKLKSEDVASRHGGPQKSLMKSDHL